MVDRLMSRLPEFMDAHTSVWTTVLFHRDDIGTRKRPTRFDVTLRLDFEGERVAVALSLENGPIRLSRTWTGSLQDAPDLIVDWTAELLRLRERRGERVALEINLEPQR